MHLFRKEVDLKNYCTLQIGGPAHYFCEVHTVCEMEEALKACREKKIPVMVIGKGSNCLFDDRGFNGAVILNKINFCRQTAPGTFYAGAGYSFSHLGIQASRLGFGGLEFASGIPASVGGAIFMNAGANLSETSTHLKSVEYISVSGELILASREDLSFSYRYSSFHQNHGVIVAATFSLPQSQNARQKQIDIVNKRKMTQPYGFKSAGCIFLNPECEAAGSIIDRCGLKGLSVGGAEVSCKHANFLINKDQATCADMLQLIELVKMKVKVQTGIELHAEVRQIPYKE